MSRFEKKFEGFESAVTGLTALSGSAGQALGGRKSDRWDDVVSHLRENAEFQGSANGVVEFTVIGGCIDYTTSGGLNFVINQEGLAQVYHPGSTYPRRHDRISTLELDAIKAGWKKVSGIDDPHIEIVEKPKHPPAGDLGHWWCSETEPHMDDIQGGNRGKYGGVYALRIRTTFGRGEGRASGSYVEDLTESLYEVIGDEEEYEKCHLVQWIFHEDGATVFRRILHTGTAEECRKSVEAIAVNFEKDGTLP